MEVTEGRRRQGLGTRAIDLLRQQHPGRTVFVRPPGGEDAFWQSLGWEHVRHAQNGDYPPLLLKRRPTTGQSERGLLLPEGGCACLRCMGLWSMRHSYGNDDARYSGKGGNDPHGCG